MIKGINRRLWTAAPSSVKPCHNKNEWMRKLHKIPTDANDKFSEALKLNNISLTEKPVTEIMPLARLVFKSHTDQFKPGCLPPNSKDVMTEIVVPQWISASIGVGHYGSVELAVLLAFMVRANSDSAPGLRGPHVLRRQKEGIKSRMSELPATLAAFLAIKEPPSTHTPIYFDDFCFNLADDFTLHSSHPFLSLFSNL